MIMNKDEFVKEYPEYADWPVRVIYSDEMYNGKTARINDFDFSVDHLALSQPNASHHGVWVDVAVVGVDREHKQVLAVYVERIEHDNGVWV